MNALCDQEAKLVATQMFRVNVKMNI